MGMRRLQRLRDWVSDWRVCRMGMRRHTGLRMGHPVEGLPHRDAAATSVLADCQQKWDLTIISLSL
jgi:hypothetical protein